MTLKQTTAAAAKHSEELVSLIRDAADMAEKVDPFYGHCVRSSLPDAVKLKNSMCLIDGAAGRISKRAKA